MPRTTTPKRKGNSGKGSSFEREVAKKLSLWWTEGGRDDIFWRTSQSGGRATTRFKSGKSTAGSGGDLTFIDDIGKPLIDYFLIELKRGYTKDIDVLSVLDNGERKRPPTLLQFWEQAERDRALNNRKENLVIFRRDGHKACVLFTNFFYQQVLEFGGVSYFCDLHFTCSGGVDMRVMLLDSFLNWLSPHCVKRLWNQM